MSTDCRFSGGEFAENVVACFGPSSRNSSAANRRSSPLICQAKIVGRKRARAAFSLDRRFESGQTHGKHSIHCSLALEHPMNTFCLSLIVQLTLGLGMAGLLWPEKFMPVFEILMFPWAASHRALRLNAVCALAISVLLFAALLLQ